MNNLILNKTITMSSREIASLTNKQHQHVKRDIEKMLIELKKDVSNFGRIYIDSMNRSQTEYFLDRDYVDCLLTGYSAELRMRVIRRWKELESVTPKLPNNYIEALENLIESEKQKEILALQVEELKPAKHFVDRYVDADGTYTFTQVAKLLNIKQPALKLFLVENGIIYYTGSAMTPYQKHVDAGRMLIKAGVSNDGHSYNQMRFTAKGINWLSNLLNSRFGEVA